MSKREKILSEAAKLFASRGFDGTSVREIAKEAELSVPGMFHYFASKEDILNEIMTGSMDEVYKGLLDIYDGSYSSVEKLDRICKFYVSYYSGHKDQLTILGSEKKSLSEEHLRIFIDKQRLYVKALKKLLNDLSNEGHLKSLNISVIAFIFFGMVHLTYIWYSPEGKIKPEELGDVFSEVFLRGILK